LPTDRTKTAAATAKIERQSGRWLQALLLLLLRQIESGYAYCTREQRILDR